MVLKWSDTLNEDKWFSEDSKSLVPPRYTKIRIKYKEILFSQKSPYQKIDIYDTYDHGKMLTLDNLVMVTERDEFFYHEMLSHVSLFTHPNPKKVLVIGGGDGGTLREVIKHSEVQDAHLCEIDEMVTKKSMEYFDFWDNVKDDPRVKLFFEDGFNFLERSENTYDIILVDSTDPIGEAEKLFDISFYKLCYNALNDNGILVVQSESPHYNVDVIQSTIKKYKSLFAITNLYTVPIPTYPSGYWSFLLGSKNFDPLTNYRVGNYKAMNLKYYNNEIHKACFALSNYLKEAIS